MDISQQLILASARGDLEEVMSCLQQPQCDVTATDAAGCTAMMRLEQGDIERTQNNNSIMQLFLQNRLRKVNSTAQLSSSYDCTLSQQLFDATKIGDVIAVTECLDNPRCDVGAKDQHGYTAFQRVMQQTQTNSKVYVKIKQALLEQEAIIHEATRNRLVSAAEHGDLEGVLSCLHHKGCDVNSYDSDGYTALMWAVVYIAKSEAYTAIIKTLLQCDELDINAFSKGIHPFTALQVACGHSLYGLPATSTQAVELLINDTRCDVNLQDKKGWTPLRLAVSNLDIGHENTTVIEALMQHPDIDTLLMTEILQTPTDELLNQSQFKHARFDVCTFFIDVLKMLISRKDQNEHNLHTLARAITYSPLQVAQLLLANNFEPNSYWPRIDISQELDKLFMSSVSEEYETALHCAVSINSLTKVSLLIEHSADVTAKWRDMTPLQLAIAYNSRPDILCLLSKNMSKSDVAQAIEKCSMVGESVQECITRLGVSRWINLFEMSTATTETAQSKCLGDPVDSKIRLLSETDPPAQIVSSVLKSRAFCRCAETAEIQGSVIQLLRMVSNILGCLNIGLEFEPVLAGSMGEGTKVHAPVEADVKCILREEMLHAARSGHSYTCKRPAHSSLPKWIQAGVNNTYAFRLSVLFYHAVDYALRKIIDSHVTFGKLWLFKQSLVFCDKVSRLQLMWKGQQFKNMMISVDLALCVPVAKEIVEKHSYALVEKCNAANYFLIAKRSRHYILEPETVDTFKLSGSNLEKTMLQRLPINAKRGLILAKAVRVASIAKPDEDLRSTFCLAEDINVDDMITSHVLKSCLFLHTAQCVRDACTHPCTVAINIYQLLKQQLTEKKLESWMDGTIFDCSSCTTDNTCCMKRKLMLAMTFKILEWLQDNETQLQDIDYADGFDHCDVKTLVYQRL